MSTEQGPDADRVRALAGGVRLSLDGRVAAVRLDRPEIKNAQTFATWASLTKIATQLLPGRADVVLISGAGADFSAGLDLRQLRGDGVPGEGSVVGLSRLSPPERENRIAEFQRAFSSWRELDAVVIAVVQGRAIGAGFQLALAADLRIATADASFTMAEARLGLVPDLGGTHRLTELVGYSRALQICATAQPVPAPVAHEWGVVNDCVPADRVSPAVDAWVESITTHRPGLVAELKGLLRSAATAAYADQLALERRVQARLLASLPE